MADNEDRMPSDARGSLAWDVEGAAKMEHHYGTEARAVQLRAFAARARQLEAEVSRLAAALDRVRDDAARLDWLLKHQQQIGDWGSGGWHSTHDYAARHETAREAIDAARTQPEGNNG